MLEAIPWLVRRAPLTVLPDPGTRFQLVHHDDVATALVAAVRGAGAPGIYNLAGPGELTARDLGRELGWPTIPVPRATVSLAALGAGLPLVPSKAQWLNAFRVPVLMSYARARKELRWKPRHDAESTLAATVAAARERGLVSDGRLRFGRGFPDAGGAVRPRCCAQPLPSPPQEQLMNIQRWTLVVVCAATAMLMLDIAVVNTALSRIAEDLDTGLSGLQWVVDAYTLALASVVLTAGALADRLGRRRLFTIGLAIFTVASVACGLAQDIVMLNSARAVQGVGAAIMFAVSLALLAHAFPNPRERAGALAAYGAAIGASFAVGPLVGGLLTSGLDWQWIFLVNVPIGLVCLWITRAYVEESRDPNAHGIDWPGQITLTAGLFLLVLALLRGNEDGWTSTVILAELIGAAVALVAFVLVELRVRTPMLPMRLFRDATFTGAQIAAFAISASFFAIFLYATLYLQQILGLSAIEAGLVYLPGTILMLIVSGATAQLGAKVPARTMIAGGLALVAVGMALFTLADETSSWWAVMPGLLLACLGTGFFNPALSNVALGSVPVEQSGLAAGVNDTARQAGIAVGVAALGALIPAEAALNGGGAAEYVAGLHDAFYVAPSLAAAGAVAAALLISKRFGTAATVEDGAPLIEPRAVPEPA